MMIGEKLNQSMNQQIANEFGASLQYVAIAAYFESHYLKLMAKLFFEQAEEEREHAMKFVHYILETGGKLQIPAVAAPKSDFASAEEAVQAALNWEVEVTGQINALMDIAVEAKDYLGQSFLRWFVDEQLEEVAKMEQLLGVVRSAGDKNLFMMEAYLAHLEA
ncbi:MAG: ferritin [Anaerolineales bacterium]